MGAIVPTLTQGVGLASSLAGTVNTINRVANTFSGGSAPGDLRAQQDLALRHLQQRQNAQAQQLANDTALDRERILQAQKDERGRLSTLKRAMARQRASVGASGASSGDGSAQAVLLGLFEESEDELAQREQLDTLRNRALDLDVSNQSSINILQRTQLQEKQRLARHLGDDRLLF